MPILNMEYFSFLKKNLLSILTITILIIGIFFILFQSDGRIIRKLPENYLLFYSEEMNGVALVADIKEFEFYAEVIAPPIQRIGNDNDFIIVQAKNSFEEIYYIIPLKNRINYKSPDLNKIGPLTKEQFDKKVINLKISPTLKMENIQHKLLNLH